MNNTMFEDARDTNNLDSVNMLASVLGNYLQSHVRSVDAQIKNLGNNVPVDSPKYSGEKDPELVYSYVVKVQKCLRIRNIVENEQKLLVFSDRLYGMALRWFNDLTDREPGLPFGEVVRTFKARFTPGGWMLKIKNKLF